jgi:hypothetical protein
MDNQQDKVGKSPNLLQVIGSVLSAAFGVQNAKNRERDFQHGNLKTFLLVGVSATIMFILLIYRIVKWVVG